MPDSTQSQATRSGNAAELLAQFRAQKALRDENHVEVGAVYGACFIYHPKGCDHCASYLAHILEDIERHPSSFTFTKDEVLDGIHEAWPHISEYIHHLDVTSTALEKELYEATADNCQLHDENEDLQAQITLLETRLESLQVPTLSERITTSTPTTKPQAGSSTTLTTPVKASYSRKRAHKLDENDDFRNRVRKYDSRPNHWSLYMWTALVGWHRNPMSVPNALREDSNGYFLEEDVDVTAWLTQIIGELPRQAIMLRMKNIFGSCTNFDMAFIRFDPNLLCAEMYRTRWLTNASLPLRVGSQVTKGTKGKTQIATAKIPEGLEFLKLVLDHCSLSREQIYYQIIPYMIRDDEKRPLSTAAVERAAYMALREQEKATHKGKKPATAHWQSKPSVHAPTPAKADEVHSEWEYVNIDVQLDPDRDTLPVDQERPEPREEEADQLVLLEGEQIDSNNEDDVLVFNSGADKVNLRQHIEGDNSFLDIVRNNYINDSLLSKVVADVSAHKQFAMRDKLLFTKNQLGRDVICIPEDAFLRGRRLVEIIID
ncbi:hypothetical protein M422DRAFT_264505 [Sphaerobolus stellatus SS14]|uniref:Uncharacterized protein n=1 Tax=Sphaerobolus stellatus (strain SS14) TaxID=990650 RepID=A0A0C9V8D4_SPHS4|nr:hypothetical protein M422DRAFT_264505 [Sphaerobolus stellatus SS14]